MKVDRFNQALDDYIKSDLYDEIDEDTLELFNIAKELNDMEVDLSDIAKKKSYNRINSRLEDKREKVRSSKLINRIVSFGFIIVFSIGFFKTGFAQETLEKILRIIKLNNTVVKQEAPLDPVVLKVPERLKGEIFDVEGRELKEIVTDMDIYDKNGGLIEEVIVNDGSGYLNYLDRDKDVIKTHNVYSMEDVKEIADFKLLEPKHLPRGYGFKEGSFYYLDGDKLSKDRVSITYSDGENDIYISENSLKAGDYSYSSTILDIDEININNNKGVIDELFNIDIEIDNIAVRLNSMGKISREEALKIIKYLE